MKRKVLIVIYIILILITLKLLYNFLINSILINNYEKGKYTTQDQARALTFLNFSESYIANYNYGNILYQNEEYEKAIEEYKKSLKGFIPKNKECNIRINYALAVCKTVSVDEKNQSSINNAIEKYESAIEILTQKGCANKNDDKGHSQEAEILKKDIQKEIDRLKKLQNKQSEEEKSNEKEEKQQEETIETKIQDIKENATQKQRETENQFKTYNNVDYNKNNKNW